MSRLHACSSEALNQVSCLKDIYLHDLHGGDIYLHDGCSEALNQGWAVGCVTLSSTEALTLVLIFHSELKKCLFADVEAFHPGVILSD